MKRPCTFFLLLFFATTPALQAAPVAAAATGPVLSQLKRQAAGVTTIDSDFAQEKFLSMFRKTLTSRGHFLFARPDRLRWEILSPVATGFVIEGGQGQRWHQHSGKTESFELAREPVMQLVAGQLIAWAAADFDKLEREYGITVLAERPVSLKLVPRGGAEKFLDHLRVVFAPDGSHVQLVEVHEKDGDHTRIRFFNTRINRPPPPEGL